MSAVTAFRLSCGSVPDYATKGPSWYLNKQPSQAASIQPAAASRTQTTAQDTCPGLLHPGDYSAGAIPPRLALPPAPKFAPVRSSRLHQEGQAAGTSGHCSSAAAGRHRWQRSKSSTGPTRTRRHGAASSSTGDFCSHSSSSGWCFSVWGRQPWTSPAGWRQKISLSRERRHPRVVEEVISIAAGAP